MYRADRKKNSKNQSELFWQYTWTLYTNTTGIIQVTGFDVYNNEKIQMIDMFNSAI